MEPVTQTGTVIKTRKDIPSAVRVKGFKLRRSETVAWRRDELMVLAWRDKGKPVIMIFLLFFLLPAPQ